MTTFSIERFEAWLESQPEGREFDYYDIEHCIVCAFVRETTNEKEVSAGGIDIKLNRTNIIPIPYYIAMALAGAKPLTIKNVKQSLCPPSTCPPSPVTDAPTTTICSLAKS